MAPELNPANSPDHLDRSNPGSLHVFAAWADRNVFTAVQVEGSGGIECPGEIDMCPDALYLRLTGKAIENVFPSLKPARST